VEAVISLFIISVMLVASLRMVGASRLGQTWNADHERGLRLAQDLMAEICDQAYSDPNEPPVFGPEPSETAGRPAYDDVDDYNGLSEAPPRDRSGNAIPGLSNWRRAVDVAFVSANDPTSTSVFETGVKRITVTVYRSGVPMARLVALRASAVAR
jgi:hypothetical protein